MAISDAHYMRWPPEHMTLRMPATANLLVLVSSLVALCASWQAVTAQRQIGRLEGRLAQTLAEASASAQQQLAPTALPHKYGLSLVNPRKLQLERGGCWAFTAVGLLEDSYRRHAVARGWLAPDQYLRLSEQAFGIAVLDACRAAPLACIFDDDEIATGTSTEGGEVPVLYYLRNLGASGAVAWSVCPYTPSAGNDRLCPGLSDERASSPLRFEVSAMTTYYDVEEVKAALRSKGHALGLSTAMANAEYRVACTEETAHILGCDPDDKARCVPCPIEPPFLGIPCCFVSERPMNNLRGEFFGLAPMYVRHSPLRLEGGHAMVLVGYSDTFVTSDGYRGGFIVRNSWWAKDGRRAVALNHDLSPHPAFYALRCAPTLRPNLASRLCPPFVVQGGMGTHPLRCGTLRAPRILLAGFYSRSATRMSGRSARTSSTPPAGTAATRCTPAGWLARRRTRARLVRCSGCAASTALPISARSVRRTSPCSSRTSQSLEAVSRSRASFARRAGTTRTPPPRIATSTPIARAKATRSVAPSRGGCRWPQSSARHR